METKDWEKEVYEFAKDAHKEQKDDDGKPYFDSHIMQVVHILKQVTTDEDIIKAAYLHDTIEDTNVNYEQLKNKFGQRVADLVNEVTHEGKKDTIGHWFPRLKTKEGILLKFSDRLSNLSRMDAWDEDRRQHYLKKSKFWSSAPKEDKDDKVTIKFDKKELDELMKKGKELNKKAIEMRADLKRLFGK